MTREQVDQLHKEIVRRCLMVKVTGCSVHGLIGSVMLRCGIDVEARGICVASAMRAAVDFYDELLGHSCIAPVAAGPAS
jgi:hypothetical protein